MVSMDPEYRTRRPHRKSRNGCQSCKQRRKKCDERKPRCSRCIDRDLSCQYQLHQQQTENWRPISPVQSRSPTALLPAHETDSLSPNELELLRHYLTHTSRVIPYDDDDLYALQEGFPNLAFRCRTLMNSILALAAICKCHDILMQPIIDEKHREQALTLLLVADSRHKESLRQTQNDISDLHRECYDSTLANAPLMVLYILANHSVRIKWAETMPSVPTGFVPTQLHWVLLIRAAHLAYSGMLSDIDHQLELCPDTSPPADSPPTSPLGQLSPDPVNHVTSPEDGPRKHTRELFLPILAATSHAALTGLRIRAEARRAEMPADPEIEFSFVALKALEDIADEVFRPNTDVKNLKASHSSDQPLSTSPPPQSRLACVSPWLRNYLARVTMATPTRPLRRNITAFVNRVPAEYLNLVQLSVEALSECRVIEGLTPSQGLAVDIFSHWLVLMMLLDGVWWIGGIGAWELRRIVNTVGDEGFGEREGKTTWWPASMYNIYVELKKQVATDA
ncbi:putative transcriptional regulatory protein [Triangularia verruculosa]|uniref:Transcriptional regulatory protein n=1 Tax=Triangularia verruculosa TaxID=2587418 RepID=A0AAN6XCE5_9PEZI|nr:putative transcriptional regulatory protein [Triangularia verruculosa]